jgi:BirA family biotin operon repressor/biotin-[acetyl-CoA-carboxylase] ligase
MNRPTLQDTLSDLPLGPVRYYKTIDSTNLAAAQWVLDGASHFSLVVADEQTAGRGRHGRRWFTPPGSALAFSLIIKSERLSLFQDKQDGLDHVPSLIPSRLTALGALAVCESLQTQFGLNPQIKWPNDVLVNKCKVAGVLVEAQWQSRLLAAILGIGINIAPASIPADKDLTFPATSVETVLGKPVDRWILLHEVLESIVRWQQRLSSKEFIQTWEELLAFKGEWVQVVSEKRQEDNPENIREGQVLGLSDEGALKLQAPSGERFEIQIGELQLRPVKG